MQRKNKKVLGIAVLFLLSILLLIFIILLQIHSTDLRKEITARKEMHAIEEKQEQRVPTEHKETTNSEELKETTTSAILEIKNEETKSHKTIPGKSNPAEKTKPEASKPHETKKELSPTTTIHEIITETTPTEPATEPELAVVLSVNLKTKKIHGPNCPILKRTNPDYITEILREEAEEYLWEGYSFCSKCRGYAR